MEEVALLLARLSSPEWREQHPRRAADCMVALAEQLVRSPDRVLRLLRVVVLFVLGFRVR